MNKKMIVLDLDGTILTSDRIIPKESFNYLMHLKELGYIIVIASGRILDSALNISKMAPFSKYIISNSGAVIYNNETQEFIKKNTIEKDTVRKICSIYDNNEIDYINLCDTHYFNRYSNNKLEEIDYFKNINNIEEFIDKTDILSIVVNIKINIDNIYNKLNKLEGIKLTIMCESLNHNNKWIEITKPNTSKYNSIKVISKIENISNDNIISFGDSPNDLDMIEKCGIGVAMGNAVDEVKAVANYITDSHDNDGVIKFLKKYLKEKE